MSSNTCLKPHKNTLTTPQSTILNKAGENMRNKELFIDWLAFWDTEECENCEDCSVCMFESDCCDYQQFLKDNKIKKGK